MKVAMIIKPGLVKQPLHIKFEDTVNLEHKEELVLHRSEGEFANRAYRLSNNYYWTIAEDVQGFTLLIPTKNKVYE